MKKFLYILRKYLWLIILIVWAIVIIVNEILKTAQSTIFVFIVLGMITTYFGFMLKPSKNDYSKNGEKWKKKYEYTKTTEETKSHKDGSFEVIYMHHFDVHCTNSKGETYTYDLVRNGGVSGKDKNGKEYSKKIPVKLFLKNIDALEEKN